MVLSFPHVHGQLTVVGVWQEHDSLHFLSLSSNLPVCLSLFSSLSISLPAIWQFPVFWLVFFLLVLCSVPCLFLHQFLLHSCLEGVLGQPIETLSFFSPSLYLVLPTPYPIHYMIPGFLARVFRILQLSGELLYHYNHLFMGDIVHIHI